MNSNEMSTAIDIMISIIVITIIISVVLITVQLGNSIEDSAADKADELLKVNDTSYDKLESLLNYQNEVPLATVYMILKDNEGVVTSVKGTFLDSTLSPTVIVNNMTHLDYTTRFDKKVTVGGTKYSNDTFKIELEEVY